MIGTAVFAELTVVTDQQTYRQANCSTRTTRVIGDNFNDKARANFAIECVI